MTSVTIPSNSGPIHGGYSSSSSVTEEISKNKADFDSTRKVKRSLSITSSESCKKRRKQSTPIRISTSESESATASNLIEGKPAVPSPELNLRCPVCQLYFDHPEQLQNHIICEHPPLECKKEPEEHTTTPSSVPFMELSETSSGISMTRPDMQWINDIPNKDWLSSTMPALPFNPTNSMFMTLPQFAQSAENLPMKPIRIFNPDAYCDLCNKEFCNKYFLKTHKANKHGIYTDTLTPDQLQMQNPIGITSLSGSSKLPNSVPTVEPISIKTEPKTPVKVVNPFSNIFSNPFTKQIGVTGSESETGENVTTSNGLSSSSESDTKLPDDQPIDEYPSPNNTQTESTSLKNDPDGMFYDASNKLSPDQQNRELDLTFRLRRFGVMNPKAFCEICCKEYCNKYFLRTHKLKRHGIYIPDEKEKDIKNEGSINFPSANNVQTSPLNLIMTEQSNSDRKTTSPSNISCDTCGIKFQNGSLAQLHNVNVHGRIYSKDPDQSETAGDAKKMPEIFKPPEKSLNAEAISEDLQKLQTMILQLNDLDVSKVSATCSICSKEFENRFYLHAHMMTEHGVLLEENDAEKSGGDQDTNTNNNTMCDICGKDIQNADEMAKHILEFHSNTPAGVESSKEEYNGYNSGEKTTANRLSISSGHVPERRISMNVTPTSSYCEICNKELCNKYFMKTHMQRMHGIEIENGAQIGGVVCDICNKELCSKYFLRVHKHNTHGIVEYGSNLLPPRKSDGEPPPPPQPSTVSTEVDSSLKPTDLADLSHRYFTHFTEVCTICSRRFRSTKWLKAHLVTDHGQVGAEKWAELEHQLQQNIAHPKSSTTVVKIEQGSNPSLPPPNGGQDPPPTHQKLGVGIQNVISSLLGIDDTNSKIYQCSYCPFSTPLLPLLFVHERSHSMNAEGLPIKCPVCPQSFMERELLQRHLFSQHSFLSTPSMSREEKEQPNEETECGMDDQEQTKIKNKKRSPSPMKIRQVELSSEIGQSLKEVAKKMQWPATYAIPQGGSGSHPEQDQEESSFASKSGPGYVMQAFLLEESTSERRVMPSVVFLPMLQKQPAPITVTFTLTPA